MTDSTPTIDVRMLMEIFTAVAYLSLPAAPQPEQGAGAGRGTVTVTGDPVLGWLIFTDTDDSVSLFN